MAFQITDDALDLTATPDGLGKPIGSDIQTGKVTLPVIHALLYSPEADRRRLREILVRVNGETAPPGGIGEVQEILARSGAIEHALGVARARARRAAGALDGLRPSPARESFLGLVEFVTARSR